MSNSRINSFRDGVFARLQASIDAKELGIVSLRKNDFGVTIGNQAKDDDDYPMFVMKLKAVRMFDNISGYGEQSIEYLCSIIQIIDKKSSEIESSASSAEDTLVGLTEQVIDIITQDTCEIIDGVNYKEGIYSGKWAIISEFVVAK